MNLEVKKLTDLKNQFHGKDCLIITAGPSLKNACKNRIRDLSKGKVVIAVKQAYYYMPEIVDIHVLNDNNYEVYDYTKAKKSIKILLVKSEAKLAFTPKCNYDIKYVIDGAKSDLNYSIAQTYNFTENESMYKFKRLKGPGIMYEICIYFPVFFKSKEVIFVSWDLGFKNSDLIKRYYEKASFFDLSKKYIIKNHLSMYNKYLVRIENIIRIFLYLLGFRMKLGIPTVTKNEANIIADSTFHLSQYYKTKNIKHYIYSNESMLSNVFERII
jgi:hypothetical protein